MMFGCLVGSVYASRKQEEKKAGLQEIIARGREDKCTPMLQVGRLPSRKLPWISGAEAIAKASQTWSLIMTKDEYNSHGVGKAAAEGEHGAS